MGVIMNEVQLAVGWKVDSYAYYTWLQNNGEDKIPIGVYVIEGKPLEDEYEEIVIISLIPQTNDDSSNRDDYYTRNYVSFSLKKLENIPKEQITIAKKFAEDIDKENTFDDIEIHAILDRHW